MVPLPTCRADAISRTDAPASCVRVALDLSNTTRFRPNRTPLRLALRTPAHTRSLIISRSNSATDARMCRSRREVGLDQRPPNLSPPESSPLRVHPYAPRNPVLSVPAQRSSVWSPAFHPLHGPIRRGVGAVLRDGGPPQRKFHVVRVDPSNRGYTCGVKRDRK